jgi:hypothetical protein
MKPTKKTNSKDPEKADKLSAYYDRIHCWNLEEGLWYTADLIGELHALQETLTGSDAYGLLVNAANNAVLNLECLERLVAPEACSPKAIAIVTGENLATFITANFFLKTSPLQIAVKLFKTEEIARTWLKERIECAPNEDIQDL